MFKLSLKIVLLFVSIVVVLLSSGIVLKGIDTILLKRAIPFVLIIGLVAIILWRNSVFISLKPLATVHNKIIVIPAMVLLFAYSAWASDGFTSQTNSLPFVIGLVGLIYLQTFWEELIFRGIILNHYMTKGVSLIKSLFYSSLIFALIHLINLWSNPSIESVINQVLFSIVMGVFLGAFFLLCRNIYLAGLAHTLINFPSYANKYQNDSFIVPEQANSIAESTPLSETIMGTFLLLLVYSPFLLVGLAFLYKVKKDIAKTPLILINEFAFKPFRSKG
ncbi:MAG: CPBP family intramembrane glutamic endopeptidase [Gilvibacter sp.]